MNGRIESRVLRYMPAMTADKSDLSPVHSEQPAAAAAAADDDDVASASSATKQAMLLSLIHSRRFRE